LYDFVGRLFRRRSPEVIKELVITIEIELEEDEDRFYASVPALKGLHVDGASEEEALRAATGAVEAYITSLIKHGDPLPVGMIQTRPSSEAARAAPKRAPHRASRIVTTQVHCPA
jgi:predicted RNase H-like HicB family nuclease